MKKKAKFIVNRTLVLSNDGRYEGVIQVLEVVESEKFPLGIKARFVLLDTYEETARLLVDNHEPYGFHMHTKLPGDHRYREKIETNDYEEALQIFLREVERIIRHEKK